MTPTAVGVLAVAALLLVACGDDDESDDDNNTPQNQLANPASVFCVEQGGELEIVDEADGQIGFCNLPDGTRVEEWQYFREQTGGTVPADEGG